MNAQEKAYQIARDHFGAVRLEWDELAGLLAKELQADITTALTEAAQPSQAVRELVEAAEQIRQDWVKWAIFRKSDDGTYGPDSPIMKLATALAAVKKELSLE